MKETGKENLKYGDNRCGSGWKLSASISPRLVAKLAVKVSHRESRGNCFIPFHFREAAANLLTIDEIDPFGKIPEFKFCAVRIDPATGSELAGAAGEAAPQTQER